MTKTKHLVIARHEAISSLNGLGVNQIASYLAMTMNNTRLISNRIPLILQNHDHVSLKINADASGWFARNDDE